MKHAFIFSALAVCLALLCSACALQTPSQPESVPDKSGRYTLSATGEAVIREAETLPVTAAEDNARVFYEIFVGSFSDSDGDGVGDLRGIINRMDYLNDGDPGSGCSLGIEGIWLTPIFLSPSYHKYDVTDYYAVDPQFGTEEDFRELAALCHERNVKLILDLPINHTGSQNPWFKAFAEARQNSDWESPYYDFYSVITASQSAPYGRRFRPIGGCRFQYECNFSDDMPELNYDNPAVRQAVVDVARHYLELGVDGFRFDAAKYIYYGDHAASVDFWQWYMDQLRAMKPDIYTVAEVWDADGIIDKYLPPFNCFAFALSQSEGYFADAAKHGNVNTLTSYTELYQKKLSGLRSDAMLVPFLSNHDQDRVSGYLTVSSGYMHMGANLCLLSPGSPFIYYGEELGLRGSRGGANTDANRRLAMVWGDGDTVQDPEGTTYKASNQISATVMDQRADGDSMYSYYKRLLQLRAANPEIARGDYRALPFRGTNVGGFLSTLGDSTVCVLHNTTSKDVTLDLSQVTELTFREITAIGLGEAALEGNTVTLSAQTSAILR